MNAPLRAAAALALFSACAAAPPRAPAHPAHPVGNGLAPLISMDDYPLPALRNEEQGDVAVRLDIDPSGGVSACAVTQSSRSASLDSATCALLRERARFTPARDRRGRAVPDTFPQTVHWRIAPPGPADAPNAAAVRAYVDCLGRAAQPLVAGAASPEAIADQAFAACTAAERQTQATLAAGPPAPAGAGTRAPDLRRMARPTILELVRLLRARPQVHVKPVVSLAGLIRAEDYPPSAVGSGQQGKVRVRLEVDENGRARGCTILETSGYESLDSATCRLLQERATFTPARDWQGRPVADTFSQSIAWRVTEPQQDPAVEAALGRWSSCLYGYARQHAREPAAADAIAGRAFGACRPLEPALLAAVNAAPGHGPASGALPASMRDMMRRNMVQLLQSLGHPQG